MKKIYFILFLILLNFNFAYADNVYVEGELLNKITLENYN